MIETLSGTFLVTTLLFTSPQTQSPRWIIMPSINEDIRRHTKQTFVADLNHESSTSSVLYEPATRVESDARGKLLERLGRWKTLPDGWDGELSEAPIHGALNLAAMFIDTLPRDVSLPKAMLSSSGEIGLYWDTTEIYIDLEFGSDTHFSAYFRDRLTGKERFVENLSMRSDDLDQFYKDIGSSYPIAA
jgi:hypothetical protein